MNTETMTRTAIATPDAAEAATRSKKKKSRRYPFLPTSLQGGEFMVWLKRLHGWIGMWGAIVGLIIGITGITLNHRGAIGAGSANVVDRFQLEVPAAGFADSSQLSSFVSQSLGIDSAPLPAAGAAGMGRGVVDPNTLGTRFQSTRERYDVVWVPGNRYASVTHTTSGTISTLNSLHLGNRGGIVWVLVLDAFAGSLIFTALTGILLWSKMDGSALLAMVLFFSFLAGAFYFAAVL